MKMKSVLKRVAVSALGVATAMTAIPSIQSFAADKLEWKVVDGKSYWYENDVQQGVAGGKGNVWFEGTERGKEIYDPASDAWYWLDTNANGAKAVGKEVFMPYVYGNAANLDYDEVKNLAYESNNCAENVENAKLGFQVWQAMSSGDYWKQGKWVRYDNEGRMLKGWVTIEGALAELYPDQAGNTYYYDHRTGLMAKGVVEISGKHYRFDAVTGNCLGETTDPTDEEVYEAKVAEDEAKWKEREGKYYKLTRSETKYDSPRKHNEGTDSEWVDRDSYTVYEYNNADEPTLYTSSKTYEKVNGKDVLSCETEYKIIKVSDSWTTNRESKNTNYYIAKDGTSYKSSVYNYDYVAKNGSVNQTKYEEIDYDSEGNVTYQRKRTSEFDDKGNRTKEDNYDYSTINGKVRLTSHYISAYEYNDKGNSSKTYYTSYSVQEDGTESLNYKSRIDFTYDKKDNLISTVTTALPVYEGGKEYITSKSEYEYDANNNKSRALNYSINSRYNSETQEYEYTAVLSSITEYTYQKYETKYLLAKQITYRCENEEKTDYITNKHEYKYDNMGRQISYEYWYRYYDGTSNDPELSLSSKNTYKYDSKGNDISYRYWDMSNYFEGKDLDKRVPILNSAWDYDYTYVDDPTYYSGYRTVKTKGTTYKSKIDEKLEAANLTIDYYYISESIEFDYVTPKYDNSTVYYNADDSVYYTSTYTYELVTK